MSKAGEYAALCQDVAHWCERMDESPRALQRHRDAEDNLSRWEFKNRDLIARALRRDDVVSDDVLDFVSKQTGFATYVVMDIINAFREVVR